MFENKVEGYPVENVSVRLSLRSITRAIEFLNNEHIKTNRSIDDIEYLVNKIPNYDKRRYSKYILPYVVYHKNNLVLQLLMENKFPVKNTWSYFLALISGDKYTTSVIKNYWVNIDDNDQIPLLWAAFIGNIDDFFIDETKIMGSKYNIIKFDNININNKYNMNIIINDIISQSKELEDPEEEYERKKMIKWSKDEEFPVVDRMEFAIKSYGFYKWGYIKDF